MAEGDVVLPVASTARARSSFVEETGSGVPSSCAKRLTRNSSTSQRKDARCALEDGERGREEERGGSFVSAAR